MTQPVLASATDHRVCADCDDALWPDQRVYPVAPGEPAEGVRCSVCEAVNRSANTPGAEL